MPTGPQNPPGGRGVLSKPQPSPTGKNKDSFRYKRRAERWEVHKKKMRANRAAKRKAIRRMRAHLRSMGIDPDTVPLDDDDNDDDDV